MERVESISFIICWQACGKFASNPVVPWVHVEGWAVCDSLSLGKNFGKTLLGKNFVADCIRRNWICSYLIYKTHVLYVVGIHYLILQCVLSQDLTKTASDFIILNIRQISAGSISLCISRWTSTIFKSFWSSWGSVLLSAMDTNTRLLDCWIGCSHSSLDWNMQLLLPFALSVENRRSFIP